MSENDELIDRVIAVTESLTDVIRQENTLLTEKRPRDAAQLQDRKAKLTANYSQELQTLQRQGQVVRQAAPEVIGRLRAVTDRFQETLSTHVRLVTTLKSVTENVIKAISDEVGRRNNPVQIYGKNASMRRPAGAVPTSLSFNRTI
jgi:phage-related minor tail protein